MSKKIKMLVIPSDASGVGYFRSIWPHQYIQEHYSDEFDIDIIYLKDINRANLIDFLRQYDIIHFHKQLDRDGDILNTIKFLEIPVILDIDDHYKLGPDHPMFISSQRENWAQPIVEHIKKVDYVTTTTSIFANILKKHNKNVKVFPNAINPQLPQFQQTKKKSDKIRFGLICGSSHKKDIELMNAIESIPEETRNKMQIVLCGFDTNGVTTIYDPKTGNVTRRPIYPQESVWCEYENFLTNNLKLVSPEHADFLKKYIKGFDDPFENDFYRRFWTKDIQNYAKHYENVDVLLAPLKENDFNSVKSQLKFIECGFTDTAIIASNFGPYTIDGKPYIMKGGEINNDGNCLLVDPRKNHKDWVKYIKYLVGHPEAIETMRENLKTEMREKYSMEKVARDRVAFYKSIVEEKQNKC